MTAKHSLFDRRLLIVAGKGGVGKTTVACALATVAAGRGNRTLLAEVDGVGRAAQLLGVSAGGVGEPRAVHEGLSVMSIEGSAALAEYLGLILPAKRIVQAVLSSRIYQYFVAAAPGLKELMTIGKIWYEAERHDGAAGRPAWDIVVLDAPATGHGLQYLGMPAATRQVFRSGLVGRESQRLVDLLSDPERTAINLVTTAEDMAVNETIEMYARLRDELGLPLGFLFLNRMHRATVSPTAIAALEPQLDALSDDRERRIAREAFDRAREEASWTGINRRYRRRLASETDLPIIEIPFCFTERFGAEQVSTIAAILDASVGLAR